MYGHEISHASKQISKVTVVILIKHHQHQMVQQLSVQLHVGDLDVAVIGLQFQQLPTLFEMCLHTMVSDHVWRAVDQDLRFTLFKKYLHYSILLART